MVWAVNGVPVSTAANDQNQLHIATDAAGGAWIAWLDSRDDLDIYAQHIDSLGAAKLTAEGKPVTKQYWPPAVYETSPVIAEDGLGGLYICWNDDRDGNWTDLYAQHFNATGDAIYLWTGLPIATAGVATGLKALCPDLQGGAYIAWADARGGSGQSEIFGQHVSFDGGVSWAANGMALADGPSPKSAPLLLPDGLGGALLAWSDYSVGANGNDVYAQQVRPDGTREWGDHGVAVSRAAFGQYEPQMMPDGGGGFIASWLDGRGYTTYGIYAQRMDSYGMLGEPAPSALVVADTKNDQGGRVKVSWEHSYMDSLPTLGVAEYRLWRSVPQAGSAMLAARRGITRDPDDAFRNGRLLVRAFGAREYAWEPAGAVPAASLGSYSLVTATTCDSLPGSNPYTVFMVEARGGTLASSPHWFSAPDSGYSVDNIGPLAPGAVSGQYQSGSSTLHWLPNRETDLAGYRIYRGSSPVFCATDSSRVAAVSDTGFVDAYGALACYKLTAVDVHGNESAPTSLTPTTTPGPIYTLPSVLQLSRPQPNPASISTTLAFAMPASGHVKLAVFDATGRNVRELVSGVVAAGDHVISWDLCDGQGHRTPVGLYFGHLATPMGTRVQRIVVTE